jgi:predicted RND superfamily exporter protein
MWHAIGSFSFRNRLRLLIGLGLLSIFFGFYATQVQMTYDFAKVVPQDDPDYIDYVKFKETFGEDGNILVIGAQSKDLFKLAYFNDLYDLCNEIEAIEGVEKVVSITKAYNLFRNDSLGKLEIKQILTKKFKTQTELDSFQNVVKSLKFYHGLLYNPESDLVILAINLNKKQLDSKARIPLVSGIEKRVKEFGFGWRVLLQILPNMYSILI